HDLRTLSFQKPCVYGVWNDRSALYDYARGKQNSAQAHPLTASREVPYKCVGNASFLHRHCGAVCAVYVVVYSVDACSSGAAVAVLFSTFFKSKTMEESRNHIAPGWV